MLQTSSCCKELFYLILKVFLSLNFGWVTQNVLGQKTTNTIVNFSDDVNLQTVSYTIWNGSHTIESPDSISKAKIIINEKYYSPGAVLTIDYGSPGKGNERKSFLINDTHSQITLTTNSGADIIKNASLLYDTAGKWGICKRYLAKELSNLRDFGEQFPNPQKWGTPEKSSYRNLCIKRDRKMEQFLKAVPTDYEYFTYYREQCINTALFFFPKDISYLKSLKRNLQQTYGRLRSLDSDLKALNDRLTSRINFPDSGSNSPAIQVADINGKMIDLNNFKGNYVLLDFWATWCPPCLANTSLLFELYTNMGSKGLEIIGISADQNLIKWRNVVSENNMNWRNVCDGKGRNGSIPERYAISTYPTYILIDQSGTIIKRTEGDLSTIISFLKNKIP